MLTVYLTVSPSYIFCPEVKTSCPLCATTFISKPESVVDTSGSNSSGVSFIIAFSVSNINFLTENIDETQFKHFKNSDAQRCIDFYNENINSLYKYSLSREKEELYDKFAQGLHSDTSFKYIVEDNDSKNIKAVIKILTFDNKNYIFDYVISQGYVDMFPMILSFAVKKITKRNKNFKLYIKNRKYLQAGEQLDDFFKNNRFELLQNNAILVRDFFKNIKQESSLMNSAIVFSGFEV